VSQTLFLKAPSFNQSPSGGLSLFSSYKCHSFSHFSSLSLFFISSAIFFGISKNQNEQRFGADRVDKKIWRTSYLVYKKSHIEREKIFLNHLLVIWQQRYHIPQEKHKEKCFKRMSEEE
jgi:hypothetical protein